MKIILSCYRGVFMKPAYADVIRRLSDAGISAEFHQPDQLVLPSRIWITWSNGWYISTWVPACYRVPADADVVAICTECLAFPAGSPWYTIPAEILARYALERITDAEIRALLPELVGEADDP